MRLASPPPHLPSACAEEIDAGAFFACLRLKSLVLPTTLRKVGYGAFEALTVAPALPPSAIVDDPFADLK